MTPEQLPLPPEQLRQLTPEQLQLVMEAEVVRVTIEMLERVSHLDTLPNA